MAYGQALAEIGRTDEAIAVLRSAVVDHPDHTALGVVLSETLLQAGHVDDAWRVIARTSEVRLQDPRPHVTAALVATERGDPALAEEHARVAYELAPTNPDHALVFGNALVASGKAEEAVAVLEQGRAAVPGDPRFWTLLGEALVRAGRTPEGVRVLNEALRQNPENPGALHFRGVARTDTEPRSAAQDLRDAIRVAPNRVESYRALAQVLQKIGRDTEAAEWERRADDLSQRRERMQATRTTYLENPHDAEAAAALAAELQGVGREFEADRVRANASAFGVEP
jgi:predicted Zn-dependent protease